MAQEELTKRERLNQLNKLYERASFVTNKDSYNQLEIDVKAFTRQNYDGYSRIVEEVSILNVAKINLRYCELGMSGFQAGCSNARLVKGLFFPNCKSGFNLINNDDLLDNNKASEFNITISKDLWEHTQSQAKEKIEYKEYRNDAQLEHLQSIVDGNIPFGLTLEK